MMTLADHLRESTRCYLDSLMLECDGDVAVAARLAGLSEGELWHLLDEHHLSAGVLEVNP